MRLLDIITYSSLVIEIITVVVVTILLLIKIL